MSDQPTPVIPLEGTTSRRLPQATPLDPTVAAQLEQSAARYNDMSSHKAIAMLHDHMMTQFAAHQTLLGGMAENQAASFLRQTKAAQTAFS